MTATTCLWSLWDMLEISASEYHKAIVILQQTIAYVGKNQSQSHGQMTAESRHVTIEQLEKLRGHVEALYCQVTAMGIGDCLAMLTADGSLTYFDYGQMAANISNTLKNELTLKRVFVLDPDKQKFYYDPKRSTEPPFGVAVGTSFPSTTPEAAEAMRCYATGRDTACVMHSIRALETPLNLLASDLKVTVTRATWGDMIGDIEKAIRALQSGDSRIAPYSQAATSFRHIKNAWRDLAMHAKRTYGSPEAWNVMDSSKTLLSDLAPLLRE